MQQVLGIFSSRSVDAQNLELLRLYVALNRLFKWKHATQYNTLIYNFCWEFLKGIDTTNKQIYKGVACELSELLIDLNNQKEKLDSDMIRKIKRLKCVYLAAACNIPPSWTLSLQNLKNKLYAFKSSNIIRVVFCKLKDFFSNKHDNKY